jgi:hypothetical protein
MLKIKSKIKLRVAKTEPHHFGGAEPQHYEAPAPSTPEVQHKYIKTMIVHCENDI